MLDSICAPALSLPAILAVPPLTFLNVCTVPVLMRYMSQDKHYGCLRLTALQGGRLAGKRLGSLGRPPREVDPTVRE